MHCDRAGELIGAYLDQELDADMRREVAEHIDSCPACAAVADDFLRMSRQLATIGRERAPGPLAIAVGRHLAEAPAGPRMLPRLGAMERLRGWKWLRQAAVLFLVCGLTAAATALLMSRGTDTAMIGRDVVAAHVRSLLQNSPMQIASSDVHAIKPWFAGRLDFAPAVRDLTAEGFPLAGARLDYVGERRVAALVYRRRLHVVSVFLWPAADGSDNPPRELVHRGYNVVAWSRGGIAYSAISDLNMGELRDLQARL